MPTNTNPNNRHYLDIYGDYTGTVDKQFIVSVTGANTEEKWKYSTDGGATFSAEVTIVVATEYSLSDGVKVKFTRTNAGTYTAGDIWSWTCYADLKLNDTEGSYDYIETISLADSSHLVAINQTNGQVSVIEGIDSDAPSISANMGQLNIGSSNPSTVLDFEKKNKELYIARGKGQPAKWLGYTKNKGWEGEGTEFELAAENAIDVIPSSDNPSTDAFDKFCVFRSGGGADSKNARVIVGINTEGDRASQSVNIYNIQDEKLFRFNVPTQPIAIRKWYGVNTGSSDYHCDGFAVMRVCEKSGADGEWGCTIDLWNLDSTNGTIEGQNANLYKTFHVKSPVTNSDEGKIHNFADFLIVPKYAEGASSWSLSNQRYDLIFARSRHHSINWQTNKSHGYEWLWKIPECTLAEIQSQNKIWDGDDMDDITPVYGNTYLNISSGGEAVGGTLRQNRRNVGDWYYFVKSPWEPNQTITYQSSTHQASTWFQVHWREWADSHGKLSYQNVPNLHSLEFCGYDSGGTNPLIGWTVHHQQPYDMGDTSFGSAQTDIRDYNMTEAEDNVIATYSEEYGGNMGASYGPFYADNGGFNTDESEKLFRAVKWGTYFIPTLTTSGSTKQKLFLHTMDWNRANSESANWLTNTALEVPSWLVNTSQMIDSFGGRFALKSIPSTQPLFGADGRFTCQTLGIKKTRLGLSYVRPGNRKCLTFRFGEENGKPGNWDGDDMEAPGLFPNDWAYAASGTNTAYHRFSQDCNADLGGIAGLYGTNINGLKKHKNIPAVTGAHDRRSYRLGEGIFKMETSQLGPGGVWNPNNNQHNFVMSVPIMSHYTKALYSVPMDGTGSAITSKFSQSDSTFILDTPTVATGVWSGLTCKKVFYKASFIYDGYQESALVSARTSLYVSGDISTGVQVRVKIRDEFDLPRRVTGIALYRATSAGGDTTEPETLYRFIEEISTLTFNHDESNGWWYYDAIDTGDAEGTYEAINGVSEQIFDLHIRYTVNAQQNGYMFIGNCHHSQIQEAENLVFRSQPGKYSVFDWTKDFIQLPFIPIAMKGFMGKLYVFSEKQCAVVNPETLIIEDVIEGIGCIGPKAIMISDSGMLWADYKNIYLASPQMGAIGDAIINVDDYGWLNLSLSEKKDVRTGYDAKRKAFLLFFDKTIGVTTYNRCWSFSTSKQRWDLFQTPDKVKDTEPTKDGSTVLLLNDNRVAKFLANEDTRLDWKWESKKLDFSNTMVDKKIRNVKVEGSTRNLIGVKYKTPESGSTWQSGTDISSNFSGSTNSAIKLATAHKGKLHWLKVQVTGDNSSAGSNVRAYATSVVFKEKRPK